MEITEKDSSSTTEDIELIKAQREQALACAVLSLSISLAIVFSVFGPAPAIDATRVSVQNHRKLEQESRSVLEANQSALRDVEKALQALQTSASR